ncbi:PH domain-containing protein [Nocardioides sp. TF02-7]|uniref:PH domain-containing protein n=1 Tax=Nocardioides sp. TF02-7 TaxID=2917724 RepID=UPI001F050719|nr:PH domain-containing protein [Nocardioides sp. TF02-7]UMG93235.1 PH domain-containing protein [Nocardioides sp. TF02-7]
MAISQKLLNPGENLIISTRQHPKALFVPILVLVLLLAVGVTVQVLVGGESWDWLALVVWALCAVGILWWTVRPFVVWLTTVHGITDRRIITRWGIITRRGHDVPLTRVADISIEINLIDRPFGCGSLLITDPSTSGNIRLNDVPHVEETQRRINELLHNLHARRSDDGV